MTRYNGTMKLYFIFFCLIVLFGFSSASYGEAKTKPPQNPKIYDAIILKVIDGDTFKAKVRLWNDLEKTASLRIRGIDTPELRGKCAQEKKLARQARAKLSQLFGIKKRGDRPKVSLQNVVPGKYHRYIADVFTPEGQNVAETLVEAGLARLYRRGKRAGWCPIAPKAP